MNVNPHLDRVVCELVQAMQGHGFVVLVHPESRLLGRALREAGFRSEHTLHVLGLRRR